MKKVKILITGAGAPGIKGTIYSLKNNSDRREIHITGTDVRKEAVGKYLCDNFYTIPSAAQNEEYIDTLLNICRKDAISIIIPQNTIELELLSSKKILFEEIGTQALVSNLKSLNVSNDKYKLAEICKNENIPVPSYYQFTTNEELIKYTKILGWPEKKLVVKPTKSSGSRGLKIIDEKTDRRKAFFEEKPNNLLVTLNELQNILGDKFPDLMISSYLPGLEYSVDVLRADNEVVVIPRSRNTIRSGITFNGKVVPNERIIQNSIKISQLINLEYCFGFQFKEDENEIPSILECNPRVQGTMVHSTLAGANIIYGAVKSILGESIPKYKINWETEFRRYWGGIGIIDEKVIDII